MRPDPAAIEATRRRIEREREAHGQELVRMRRVLIHAFPAATREAVVLVDVGAREVATFTGQETAQAVRRLADYDIIGAVAVRALLRVLNVEPAWWLVELGPACGTCARCREAHCDLRYLLAGANDYRTIDLPGLPNSNEVGDAWMGLFKSTNGGATWTSTLLPGYPQDASAEGLASPLKAYSAAADPVVRTGTNGLFYNPDISNPDISNPDISNATLWLAPGETAKITIRTLDKNVDDTVTFDAATAIVPVVVSQSISTDDLGTPDAQPPIAFPSSRF